MTGSPPGAVLVPGGTTLPAWPPAAAGPSPRAFGGLGVGLGSGNRHGLERGPGAGISVIGPNGHGASVRQVYLLRHQARRDEGRPVDAVGAGPGGRRGGVEPGVSGQGELGDRVGEGPADLALVLVLDGDAQVRGGQFVGRGVRAVEAQQADVGLLELRGAAEPLEQEILGRASAFGLDVEAGDDHGHRVAVAAEHVERDLEVLRRRAAAGAGQRHPVRAVAFELDGVEVRGHVGVEVGGLADLVEQLRGDGAGRDEPAGAVVLGDDAAAVGGDLGDGEPRVAAVGDLAGKL